MDLAFNAEERAFELAVLVDREAPVLRLGRVVRGGDHDGALDGDARPAAGGSSDADAERIAAVEVFRGRVRDGPGAVDDTDTEG